MDTEMSQYRKLTGKETSAAPAGIQTCDLSSESGALTTELSLLPNGVMMVWILGKKLTCTHLCPHTPTDGTVCNLLLNNVYHASKCKLKQKTCGDSNYV